MADDDDKADTIEVLMMVGAAFPVLGAMVSAPLVGTSLVTLALLDSFLIATGLI